MTQSLLHSDRFQFRLTTHGTPNPSQHNTILILGDPLDAAGSARSPFLGLDSLENAETFHLVTIQLTGIRGSSAIALADIVELYRAVLKRLEIETLYAAIGYSAGGLQLLDWLARYPGQIQRAAIVASAASLSPHARLAHSLARQLITHAADSKSSAQIGHAIAALLTTAPDRPGFGLIHNAVDADIVANELIRHAPPIDPELYIALTQAVDNDDFAHNWGNGDLRQACHTIAAKVAILSFTGDGLFPVAAAKSLFQAMLLAGVNVSFHEIFTRHGHATPHVEPAQLASALAELLEIDSGEPWPAPLYDI